MSGVFGVIDPKRQIDVHVLTNKMASAMSHRDWFVTENISNDELNLAIGRIGIGIFNRTPQPVWNAAHTIALVMAGEFYDMDKPKDHLSETSDEQIALALYESLGDEFVNQLNGAFIIAIWDKPRYQLLIANDRFGLYPLYYAHYNGRFIFAPEMKGILCDPDFHRKLDLTALAEYMRFQHLLGDKTFFEGLKLLPNASLLRYNIQTDQLIIRPYWDFSRIPSLPMNLTFAEATEEAGRLLEAAINRLTTGDYRFGVYLSGGLDSRVILGLINQDIFPITTITFGQQGCRDVAYAQKLASKVGTQHHFFEFPDGKWVKDFADLHLKLTEGFHSWIHAHGISILDQVRPLLEINLTGYGGAELNWEDPALLQARDDISFSSRLFHLLCQEVTWSSTDEAEERFLFSPKIATQMYGLAFDSFRGELAKYEHLPYPQRAAYLSRFTSDRRLFQYYTVFHRSYFEQRFPFADYAYTEFIYALPPEMLFKRKLRRAVILNRMRPLACIPYDKDNLPITNHEVFRIAAKLVQKSKSYINNHIVPIFTEYTTLYADYENWLRNELREWGESILLGERTLQRGIFNPDYLHSLWKRHLSGLEPDMIGKIAPIMTYEMMLRRFYDQ
jgi:asparagine synthase (glutamine-hydrolysing)